MSDTFSSGNPNLKRDIWEMLREALSTPLEESGLFTLGSLPNESPSPWPKSLPTAPLSVYFTIHW